MAKKTSRHGVTAPAAPALPSIPWASVCLFGVAALLFLPVWGFDFLIWDDNRHLLENPSVLAPSLDNALGFWKAPYFNLYVPLTYNAWQALALVGRTAEAPLEPWLFHLVNVLFHALNVTLAYRALLFLFRARNPMVSNMPAFLGALLFSVHPLQVAAVGWISGFRDLLGAFFLLLSLLLHLRAGHPTRHALWLRGGSLLAFFLSLSAKPAGAVLPLLLLLLDFWAFRRPLLQAFKKGLAHWAIAVPFAILTKATQPNTLLEFVTPWQQRPWVALDALGFYLYKWCWPLALGPDYGRPPRVVLASAWTLLSVVAVLIAVWGATRLYSRFPELAMGGAFFAGALLPVLGFVPFIFQAYSTVSDNYVYLPMLGFAWAFGALPLRWSKTHLALWTCALALLAFTVRSGFQLQHWRNNETFLKNALLVNPQSSALIANFAITLQKQGKKEEALALYQQSLAITPNDPTPFNAMANLLLELGRYDEVIAQLEPYLQRTRPNEMLMEILSRMRTNLGAAYYRKGNRGRAQTEIVEAIRLFPGNSRAHSNLGALYFEENRFQDAAAAFEKALALEPNNPEFRQNLELSRQRQAAP